MSLTFIEAEIIAETVRIINNRNFSRSDLLRELRKLLELYEYLEFFLLFYKRYIAILALQKKRRLSVETIKNILHEPLFKDMGIALYFMIFAMLYALIDAPEYFDELKKKQHDIDASLRPIEGNIDDDEPSWSY